MKVKCVYILSWGGHECANYTDNLDNPQVVAVAVEVYHARPQMSTL